MKMRLYELVEAAQDLQEQLECGEMDDQQFVAAIDAIGLEKKVESVCYVIKNLEAEAEAFKAEKERLAAREKTAKNAVERLKTYLVENLRQLNAKTLKVGTFSLGLSKSKSVSIIDPKLIPDQFLVKQEPKIDKMAIGRDLKNGAMVPGAILEENTYLRMR